MKNLLITNARLVNEGETKDAAGGKQDSLRHTMRSRNTRSGFFVTKASRLGLVTATLLFSACGGRSDDSPRAIAEEAYVFAFPLLESYKMLFVQSLFEGSGAYGTPPSSAFASGPYNRNTM